MRSRLAVRELALAGLALLAAAAVLAVVAQRRHHAKPAFRPEGSYLALAGSTGQEQDGRRTLCGVVIGPGTIGVLHPTLPCGTRVFVTFHGRTVLTQVIGSGISAPGRQFDLTEALAQELDLSGVQQIRWSYARAA